MDEVQKDALWKFLSLVKQRLTKLIMLNETLSTAEKIWMKDELQDALDEIFDTIMN